ncbi:hypothetical protein GCM10007079_16640 [Nocardiopsis terrae]|nr:hypothetical protein GCM10007079_16640 [Nocardiopsis terrae]
MVSFRWWPWALGATPSGPVRVASAGCAALRARGTAVLGFQGLWCVDAGVRHPDHRECLGLPNQI